MEFPPPPPPQPEAAPACFSPTTGNPSRKQYVYTTGDRVRKGDIVNIVGHPDSETFVVLCGAGGSQQNPRVQMQETSLRQPLTKGVCDLVPLCLQDPETCECSHHGAHAATGLTRQFGSRLEQRHEDLLERGDEAEVSNVFFDLLHSVHVSISSR